MKHALGFALATVTLAACGSAPEPPPGRNTISGPPPGFVAGVVYASPGCPVESASEPCPRVPVVGATVELYVADTVAAADRTDADGSFRLTSPPGRVSILVHATSELGSDTRQTVTVASDRTTSVELGLDMGIR